MSDPSTRVPEPGDVVRTRLRGEPARAMVEVVEREADPQSAVFASVFAPGGSIFQRRLLAASGEPTVGQWAW